MYPINHNWNDAIDTWYPSCAGLIIFHVDFHVLLHTYVFIFGTKPSFQLETQMEHLGADYNFILADNSPVLKH